MGAEAFEACSTSLPGGVGGNAPIDQRWLAGRCDLRFLRRQMRRNNKEITPAIAATPPTAMPAIAPVLRVEV